MTDFAGILADVEAAPPATSAAAAPPLFGEPIIAAHGVATDGADERMRRVTAAYREALADDSNSAVRAQAPDAGAPPTELATIFAAELALARHSPDLLRALRRKMAWRLHPDRSGDAASGASQTMARFNAMIDMAIAQCPRR